MASTTLRLVAGVILTLGCTAIATTPSAAGNSCAGTDGVKIRNARLLIVPDIGARSAKLTVSGRATIADMDLMGRDPARKLCSAAIGDDFHVAGIGICSLFGIFSGDDTVKPEDNAIEFALSKSLVQRDDSVSIDLSAGQSICADRLVVEVRPGPRGRILYLTDVPKTLAQDRVEFEIGAGVRSQNLSIRIAVFQEPARPDPPHAVGPTSWTEPIEGVRLQPFAQAILLSLVVALFLTFFERSYPFRADFGSVSDCLKAPVTTAMAFYTAGALMDCVARVAYLILQQGKGNPFEWFGTWIRNAAQYLGVVHLNPPTELALLSAILAIAAIVHLLVGGLLRRFGPVGQAVAFPLEILFYAAAIGVAGESFAVIVLVGERGAQWFGFEAPALVVSSIYALIAVRALRRLFKLSVLAVMGIALLVALTAFFPSDPVVTSIFAPSIGTNTAVWVKFLCYPTADFVYVATLTGFAFRVAYSAGLGDRLVAQWLMFLLVLAVSSFGIGNPTNAFAVAGVIVISSRWLLTSSEGAPVGASTAATIDWKEEERTFPFLVGGATAFIFLIQFIFEAGGTAQAHKFALLGLAHVPRTFAVGAIAALVLSRSGPSLRGDSATLKAVNISGLVLIANMASTLASLQGRERLIAVLANYLGMIASLILCAVFVYDLQRARASDGHLEWRDLFKGTTMAQSVPIISAVAIALFSALGPIINSEIGAALNAMLKVALPQAPSSN